MTDPAVHAGCNL